MGAQGKLSNSSNSMQRVKVYRLNEDGKWEDQGTGHVTVDYMERSEELGLLVIDEEDNDVILVHRISSEDIYRRQEDTIISWRDIELSTELAVSFQEASGCSFIWDHIRGVQRNLHFNALGSLDVTRSSSMEATGSLQSNDEPFHGVNNELRELPPVELSTLPLILKQEFFPKLIDLFRMCEDLENNEGLHMIFRLFYLTTHRFLRIFFGEEYILDIIGSLRYDPDISQVQHHHSFLKEHVAFKEDPEFYQYLEDHDKELLEFNDGDIDEDAKTGLELDVDLQSVEKSHKQSGKAITTEMVDSWLGMRVDGSRKLIWLSKEDFVSRYSCRVREWL